MKVFAERIYPTEQYGNIKLHVEDDVAAEESTEQVMLRLVANLKLASVEKLVYSKPVELTTQTSGSVHTQQPPKPAPPAPAGAFKDETLKHVLAELNGDIRPIHYIQDKELFTRINEDLKSHGFHWVSAGKESRWSKQ